MELFAPVCLMVVIGLAVYWLCRFYIWLKSQVHVPAILSHDELQRLAQFPQLADTPSQMIALHQHLSGGECLDCILRFLEWQKLERALGTIRKEWKHVGKKDMTKLKTQGFVPNHESWDKTSSTQWHLIVCPHCRAEYFALDRT